MSYRAMGWLGVVLTLAVITPLSLLFPDARDALTVFGALAGLGCGALFLAD